MKGLFVFSVKDLAVSLLILGAALGVCLLLRGFEHTDAFAAMIFILAVFLVARFTNGYLFGVLSAVISVLAVNYVFTYPYFRFDFTLTGYPLTIVCMLAVSIITSTLTTQAKRQEALRMEMERERTRGNLLRAISHDLRTPLTVILGANGALIDNYGKLTQSEHERMLREVNEEAEWLIRVVENLLTVTRMDSTNPTALTKELETAEELAADAVMKFRRRFPGKRVTVAVPDEPLMVPVDAILIEQVLINLLENAALHAAGSECTSVTVYKQGARAVFEVADRGPGIPQERLEHIFEGSWAGDRARPKDGRRGMGLGLSVCNSIVKAHGGEMTAKNRPGGGALLRFALPLEVEE